MERPELSPCGFLFELMTSSFVDESHLATHKYEEQINEEMNKPNDILSCSKRQIIAFRDEKLGFGPSAVRPRGGP